MWPNFGFGNGALSSLTKWEPSGILVCLSNGTTPTILCLSSAVNAFTAEDRQRIVGVVPLDKQTSIPEGSHLVKDDKAPLPNPKLGHISASCWSVEYDNPFSLAILKDGKNMIGQKLFAMSPLKNKVIPVEIVSSHYVDPKGERVRSWH